MKTIPDSSRREILQLAAVVATSGGPTMLARIGIMRALNRNQVRELDTDRKPQRWGNGSWRATDETASVQFQN
jgi:hypothetical protein